MYQRSSNDTTAEIVLPAFVQVREPFQGIQVSLHRIFRSINVAGARMNISLSSVTVWLLVHLSAVGVNHRPVRKQAVL